ncbi:unnamed protein product [Amoebophrya sp. A25]|nr:unnamed protein product [Amoebophrya sp. A25]|eukprot:GSA25T00012971001.1
MLLSRNAWALKKSVSYGGYLTTFTHTERPLRSTCRLPVDGVQATTPRRYFAACPGFSGFLFRVSHDPFSSPQLRIGLPRGDKATTLWPGRTLFIDYMTHLPRSSMGNTSIFTAVDAGGPVLWATALPAATAKAAAREVTNINKYAEWGGYELIRCDNGSHFLEEFIDELQFLHTEELSKNAPETRHGGCWQPTALAVVETPLAEINHGFRTALFTADCFVRSAEGMLEFQEDLAVTDLQNDSSWDTRLQGIVRRLCDRPRLSDGASNLVAYRGRGLRVQAVEPHLLCVPVTDPAPAEIGSSLATALCRTVAERRAQMDAANVAKRKQRMGDVRNDLSLWLRKGQFVARLRPSPRKWEPKFIRQFFVIAKAATNSAYIERLDGRTYTGFNPISVSQIVPISMALSATRAYLVGNGLSNEEVNKQLRHLLALGVVYIPENAAISELRDTDPAAGDMFKTFTNEAGTIVGVWNVDGLNRTLENFSRWRRLQLLLRTTHILFLLESKISKREEHRWTVALLELANETCHHDWSVHFASSVMRPGNFGVAVLARRATQASLESGVLRSTAGTDDYDVAIEGRVVTASTPNHTFVGVYSVNSRAGLRRIHTREMFDNRLSEYLCGLRDDVGRVRPIVVLGDFNALFDLSAAGISPKAPRTDENAEIIPSLTEQEHHLFHSVLALTHFRRVSATQVDRKDGCTYTFTPPRCDPSIGFSLDHLLVHGAVRRGPSLQSRFRFLRPTTWETQTPEQEPLELAVLQPVHSDHGSLITSVGH